MSTLIDFAPVSLAATRQEWQAAAIPSDQASELIDILRAGDSRSKNQGRRWNITVGRAYVLTRVPLSAFSPDTLAWLRSSTDPDRVARYAGQVIETPVMLLGTHGEYSPSDGGHRTLAAVVRGDLSIAALVPVDTYDLWSAAWEATLGE